MLWLRDLAMLAPFHRSPSTTTRSGHLRSSRAVSATGGCPRTGVEVATGVATANFVSLSRSRIQHVFGGDPSGNRTRVTGVRDATEAGDRERTVTSPRAVDEIPCTSELSSDSPGQPATDRCLFNLPFRDPYFAVSLITAGMPDEWDTLH
jgi:hypothetical protein